jgi:threonine/homoserine/homoserine lactone efflux protein
LICHRVRDNAIHRFASAPQPDQIGRRVTIWPLLLKGYLLGWSVAWPPGPINAEMMRRGLDRGFLAAWVVGLGACSGDFLWALAVALGAGAVINVPGVRLALGGVSILLLLLLAWIFARGALRAWRASRRTNPKMGATPAPRLESVHGGYLLGLGMALTSPWNIAFWLAVIGSQTTGAASGPGGSLALAVAVLAGATSWSVFLCTSVSLGARFATPAWQIVTPAATAALMLYFAAHALMRLASGT